MKIKLVLLMMSVLFVASCKKELTVEEKKDQLISYQNQIQDLKAKIKDLEKEIVLSDPEYKSEPDGSILVSTITPEKKSFKHYIEVRGSIDSRKNVLLSAELPGMIEEVYVKEGDVVKKGQTLVKLSSSIIENSISEVKTSLEMARVVFQKQSNLWKQNIGTEIQYLQAKNNKETLESKLATLRSQLSQSIVKAPFSGKIDEIQAREGEMAQPGLPLVRLINPDEMYVRSDVSERFIGNFKIGDRVEMRIPSVDKVLTTSIAAIGQVINEQNRTFEIEFLLPKVDFPLKPNQVVILTMVDYTNNEAFVLPTNIIQKDGVGNYIYVVKEDGENNNVEKKHIKTGLSFKGETEVINGLSGDEAVVDKGFRELSDGIAVRIASAN